MLCNILFNLEECLWYFHTILIMPFISDLSLIEKDQEFGLMLTNTVLSYLQGWLDKL